MKTLSLAGARHAGAEGATTGRERVPEVRTMANASGRTRVRLGSLLPLVLLAATSTGCVIRTGPDIATFQPARSPGGAEVAVLARAGGVGAGGATGSDRGGPPPVLVAGELVEASSNGLLVLRGAGSEGGGGASPRLYRVAWSELEQVEIPGYRRTLRRDRIGEDEREFLSRVSRYPPGLSPEQLRLLLELHGQSEPARIGGAGEAFGPIPDENEVLALAVAAAERFRDTDEALLSGYRPIGPDFPAMGVHWVNTSILLRHGTDPGNPPFLTYLETPGGGMVLTGVALGQVRLSGEPIGGLPVPGAWHDHSGTLDEEILALGLHGAQPGVEAEQREEPGFAMLHIWTHLENPDGVFGQENPAIPFVRAGVPVPARPTEAAGRGIFLGWGGEAYYLALFESLHPFDAEDREVVERVLGEGAARARALVARPGVPQVEGGSGVSEGADRGEGIAEDSARALEEVWWGTWAALESALSPIAWEAVRVLQTPGHAVGDTPDGGAHSRHLP